MRQELQNNAVRRPAPLKKGDTIGAVAPASPFDRDRFRAGAKVLNSMGFDVYYSEALFQKKGFLAGEDSHRLKMLHDLFADSKIKAVWCARGGYGSMRLLPHLDTGLIRKNPKLFIGCSDITALLNYIGGKCRLVTFHGPMIATLADADETSVSFLQTALTESRPLSISAGDSKAIIFGEATGPVAGGNLTTLCHLLGTPYFPDFSGALVFLEDIGEKPYRIDRMLTQMIFSGCLDRAAGICLGSFHNCGNKNELYRIFTNRLSSLSIPVMPGFPAGHGMPCFTIPIGLEARLDTVTKTLAYTSAAVSKKVL